MDLIAVTGPAMLLKLDSNCWCFGPNDLEVRWMALQNNRAPPRCYAKLCALFQSHPSIQTGVTVRKCTIRFKICKSLSLLTLKFDGWTWKTTGHLFYATSSYMHHSLSIGEFKTELQYGNAQFGSKSAIICPVWPWNLVVCRWPWSTIGHLFYATSSFVHHSLSIVELKLELQSGNAQFGSKSAIICIVWPWNLMDNLENNRVYLLCYFKLCASFRSHWSIEKLVLQSGNDQIGTKFVLTPVALSCDLWPRSFAWTLLL